MTGFIFQHDKRDPILDLVPTVSVQYFKRIKIIVIKFSFLYFSAQKHISLKGDWDK